MKRIYLLIFVLPYFFGCDNSSKKNNKLKENYSASVRDTTFSIKSIKDTTGILSHCFSPVKVLKQKIAVWKPTTDDFFNMPISNDALCHTKIDTIINLNLKNYLIVFRTDAYYNDIKVLDCHVCSPIYGIATVEKRDNLYTIKNFKKDLIAAGSFGNGYDTLTVEKFGKDYQLLKISSSYVGNSTITNTDTYFELENFKKVFSYFPYRNVGDSTDINFSSDYSNIQLQLFHLKGLNSDGRDEIELIGWKTFFDIKAHKMHKLKQIEIFRADDYGNYLRSLN